MEILHAPINIANQSAVTCRALRSIGLDATSMEYTQFSNDFQYKPDMLVVYSEEESEKLMDYDIYHFHFGQTLNQYKDLPEIGHKAVMNFWGSEVRKLSKAKKFNPFAMAKYTEEDIEYMLKTVSKWIDHAIVTDKELYDYVHPYFKYVHIVPASVHVADYPLNLSYEVKKPVLVHAPSHRGVKGTERVLEVVEQLKKIFDFEFRLVENVSHEEAKKIYSEATLVIDELHCSTYGLLAIECMCMGRNVISYVSERQRGFYPKDLPIISANPKTLYDVLYHELDDIEKNGDANLVKRGVAGRFYVERNHDDIYIAEKLKNIYLLLDSTPKVCYGECK